MAINKKILSKAAALLSALSLIFIEIPALGGISASAASQSSINASVSVSNANKEIKSRRDELGVTVSMDSIPFDDPANPQKNDIILAIDASGSMSGDYNNMISAAKDFLNNIDLSVHRVGVSAYGVAYNSIPVLRGTNGDIYANEENEIELSGYNGYKYVKYITDIKANGKSLAGTFDKSEISQNILKFRLTPAAGETIIEIIFDTNYKLTLKLNCDTRAAGTASSVNLDNADGSGMIPKTLALTDNIQDINAFYDELKYIGANGGTPMGEGIDEAVKLLSSKRSDATGTIILMTDGLPDSESKARAAATAAKAKGYVFYTVSLTSNEDSAPNLMLKSMATSEADHFFVMDSRQLSPVYQKIASQIGKVFPKDVDISLKIPDGMKLVAGSADKNAPIPDSISTTELKWHMNQIGDDKTARLSYKVCADVNSSVTTAEVGGGTIDYTDNTGARQHIDLVGKTVTILRPMVVINSISPSENYADNETNVNIYGSNFTSDCKVTVDGTPVTVNNITATCISAVLPAMTHGSKTVTVMNDQGSYDEVGFTVKSPSVSYITPDSGYEFEDQLITAYGEELDKIVKIYSKKGNYTSSIQNPTFSSLQFTITGKSAFKEDLTFEFSDGTKCNVIYSFVKPPEKKPEINLNPPSGEEFKNHEITVTGQDLGGIVKVSSKKGNYTSTLSDITEDSFKFTIKGKSAFKEELTFEFADGTKRTAIFEFTKADPVPEVKPEITELAPPSGNEFEDHVITVNGTNLKDIVKVSSKKGNYTSTLSDITDTSFKFTIKGKSAFKEELTFEFADGTKRTAIFEFTKAAPAAETKPEIAELDPPSGEEFKDRDVTVNGKNLKGIVKVSSKKGNYTSTLSDITEDSFKFTIKGKSAFKEELTFEFADGTKRTAIFEFTKAAPAAETKPEIAELDPPSGNEFEDHVVTVNGTNLKGIVKVSSKKGNYTSTLSDITDTSFKFTIKGKSAFKEELTFEFADGTAKTAIFEFTKAVVAPEDKPEITGLTPTNGEEFKDRDVTVNGNNLKGIVNVYSKKGNYTSTLSDITDTSFKFTITGKSAFKEELTFEFADGTTKTAIFEFTKAASAAATDKPEITELEPPSGKEFEDHVVTVNGTNLKGIVKVSSKKGNYTSTLSDITDTSFKFTIKGKSAFKEELTFEFADKTKRTAIFEFTK